MTDQKGTNPANFPFEAEQSARDHAHKTFRFAPTFLMLANSCGAISLLGIDGVRFRGGPTPPEAIIPLAAFLFGVALIGFAVLASLPRAFRDTAAVTGLEFKDTLWRDARPWIGRGAKILIYVSFAALIEGSLSAIWLLACAG